MTFVYATLADPARLVMAAAVFVAGLWAFLSPDYFWGVTQYCKCAAYDLSADQRERLSRALIARQDAEGISRRYGRWFGLCGIAIAALTLIPAVPFIVPYVVFSLGMACMKLLGYLQFRRATDRRVAPLVRRSPLVALPPGAIAAMFFCFAATLTFALYPPLRLGAIAGALATLVLGAIAWRIAGAPALLLGDDPQVEYVIDERVRTGRATSIALLACAPALVFAAMATRVGGAQDLYAQVAWWVIVGAFIIAAIEAVRPLRRRMRWA